MEGIIYKYTSPVGKAYIGQTTNEDIRRRRFNNYGDYSGVKINRAIKKYGAENFEYEILFKVVAGSIDVLTSMLNVLEDEMINKYDSINNGYNIHRGGDNRSGWHHTEEVRKKMSKNRKGHLTSDETKRKIGDANRGKHHTEEARKKMSEAKKGKTSWNKGIPMSEESREKLSKSLKGKPSPNKGVPMSEEQRRKLAEANTGKKLSVETKEKIRNSIKEYWRKKKEVEND